LEKRGRERIDRKKNSKSKRHSPICLTTPGFEKGRRKTPEEKGEKTVGGSPED